ncbi:ionotropic receptor 75a-like [Vanessa cardui]|uniref:ionotropic receptor 75a-like n=1 Tax=Vanessa cardui TaxID=171605 RepID=UPI001F131E5D|nr:ionotropic receptor 75a-like [Vanessa cardui]
MNLFIFVLIFKFCSISAVSIYIDIFKSKNLENAVMFHCQNLSKVVLNQKVFFANNIKITSLKTELNFTNIGYFGHSKLGFIVDTACTSWYSIFEIIDKRFFKRSYTWLIYTNNLISTSNTLSQYPIDINSDFILIKKSGRNNFYYLYEVFNNGFYTHGSFVVDYLGYWNQKLYANQNIRTNLTGVVLKCAVVVLDPIVNQTFEHYLEYTKPGVIVDSLHKLKFYTLIKYLENMYNYRYSLQRTNSWGYLRNGSFDGVVGALQRREADIGGTPVFFRSDRAKFIDYVAPTWQSRPCFILRHPKYPGGFYSIYTRPLTAEVWFCILAVLALSGSVMCIMFNIKALKTTGDDNDSSSSMAFLFIFSAISQQGTTLTRGSTSMKIVIFMTFIFTLTLYQYYNATVVSTLLREPPKSIKNLRDLLNSDLKAGVEDVLYNKDFFKRTKDPLALELYHRKIVTSRHYNFLEPEYGMRLVKRGGFAYHVDSITAYRIMKRSFSEREICDAHEIHLYPPQNMAAVLQKDSPYREHITVGIRKIFESGLMHRLKSIWDEPKPPCVRTPDSSIFSVTLREFSMALLMLAVGILFAVLILVGEILSYRFQKKVIKYCN